MPQHLNIWCFFTIKFVNLPCVTISYISLSVYNFILSLVLVSWVNLTDIRGGAVSVDALIHKKVWNSAVTCGAIGRTNPWKSVNWLICTCTAQIHTLDQEWLYATKIHAELTGRTDIDGNHAYFGNRYIYILSQMIDKYSQKLGEAVSITTGVERTYNLTSCVGYGLQPMVDKAGNLIPISGNSSSSGLSSTQVSTSEQHDQQDQTAGGSHHSQQSHASMGSAHLHTAIRSTQTMITDMARIANE